MPATPDIPPAVWAAFILGIFIALALDLGVFHRHGHKVGAREALGWTILWASLSVAFGLVFAPRWVPGWNPERSTSFLTGYLVELSLSLDNVFVIALVFAHFRVPGAWQHRVLFWGILGAMLMRGLMIWAGTELVHEFHFLLYAMGAFLLLSGFKMLFLGDGGEDADPGNGWVVRTARRFLPLEDGFHGERFLVRVDGRLRLTRLALVLLVVETTDVAFAVDSIPAIFGVTTDRFVIFTSNIFAILGLRSLYFLLASAMGYFQHLKRGLALVLVVIGAKMVGEHWLKAWLGDRLNLVSLVTVAVIIGSSIVVSVLAGPGRTGHSPGAERLEREEGDAGGEGRGPQA